MKKIFILLAIGLLSAAGWAQANSRPEILVLGTYHMANPGRDVYNMQADDVLAPKRQQEMAQLIEVLKKFHPTKIAVEADVGSEKVGQRYADYVAGKYALTADETEQIGFRLAKELGHKTIYPVNEDGEFPLPRVVNFAKAHNTSAKLDAVMGSFGTMVKEQDEFLKTHSVLDMLKYMNSDQMAARGVAAYYAIVPFGDPGDYAGPDLLAMWYQRNIRIYRNILALVDSPGERILVLYGAGHLGWLQQDAANDATVRLRKLDEFTGDK